MDGLTARYTSVGPRPVVVAPQEDNFTALFPLQVYEPGSWIYWQAQSPAASTGEFSVVTNPCSLSSREFPYRSPNIYFFFPF